MKLNKHKEKHHGVSILGIWCRGSRAISIANAKFTGHRWCCQNYRICVKNLKARFQLGCNSLYVNLPDKLLTKLQSVFHEAARLVTCYVRYDHITPALGNLHWLSVKERIEYKMLTTRFISEVKLDM